MSYTYIMRIGIDCRTILHPEGEKAGIGHYTYYLVKSLLKLDKKNTYVLCFDYRIKDLSPFKSKHSELKRLPFSRYKKFLPVLYSHLLVSSFLEREKLDVFHSPFSTLPLTYKSPSVITVHDLTIFKHPEWFPKQFLSIKVGVPKSIKKACKIIAVSWATKKDIMDIFNVPAEKIELAYNGVDTSPIRHSKSQESILKKLKVKKPYILYLGTLEPRKNLVRLIKAFKKVCTNLKSKMPSLNLVIAGKRGWKYDEIFEEVKDLRLKNRVNFTGYVSEEEKQVLYKNAKVFVFPSLYEGFGIPVVEAMSFGTPVVTSNISSLPEVVEKAAVLVNPEKVDEIARALESVIKDKKFQKCLREEGIKQARKFSWEKCAIQTLKVYKEVEKIGKKEKRKKKRKAKKSKKK